MDSGHSRANLSDLYQYLQKQAHVFYFVFRHPRTNWYGRLIAMCAAAYVFSPIQLIPNFIPVFGCLDDILVILLAARMMQRATSPHVLAECRELADASEARRTDEFRGAVIAPLLLTIVWFLTALALSALVATHIYF